MAGRHETVVQALLKRHGRTYCAELGIDIAKGTPSPLFRWLVASILFSARIGAAQAVKAAAALSKAGWTTVDRMAASTWCQRVEVLNAHGYARYDESTARMLGDTAAMLSDRYGGDLRRLREAAGRDPASERRLLKQCKGLGEVGVDIFFREVQDAWDELSPFADRLALATAGRLGLPRSAEGLAGLVPRRDFTRLLTALVRTELAKDHDAIRDAE